MKQGGGEKEVTNFARFRTVTFNFAWTVDARHRIGFANSLEARSRGNFSASYVWFRLSPARQWNNAHCSIPVPTTWLEIGNEVRIRVFRERKVQAAGKLLKNRRNSARVTEWGRNGNGILGKATCAFPCGVSKFPRALPDIRGVSWFFFPPSALFPRLWK